MGISFGSIQSGLPKDIVQQIVAAEKIPLQQLDVRKQKVEAKKSLVDDLTQRVEKLRGSIFANKSARSLRELDVQTSGPEITATADKNVAEPASYQLEVIQLAQKSSAITNGVEDKDETYLGVGYIQYTLPNGDEREIYVDEKDSSLTGIAKLINRDDESGMQATVVDCGDGSDNPWKLIVALDETGDINKAEFPALYFVDGEEDIFFEQKRDAQDAKIKLDGFELEVPANKASKIIPGVTLDLKEPTNGKEITLTIKEDTAKIADKVNDLIENINNVLKFIKEQNALDESTDTSQTLGGDITLQTLESRFRAALFTEVQTDSGPSRVSDLGISFQKTGLISLDKAKLEAALEADYTKVAQTLTGKYTKEGKVRGFIDGLEDVVVGATRRPGGILSSRKEGLDSQIRQIDRQISNKQRQIAKKEDMLKAKFARLEETISKIKTQGSGLAGFAGGGFNPVQQLG